MRNLRTMTWLVLWLVGFLVALMTGTSSLYAVLSVLYFGSRVVSRVRSLRDERRSQIES